MNSKILNCMLEYEILKYWVNSGDVIIYFMEKSRPTSKQFIMSPSTFLTNIVFLFFLPVLTFVEMHFGLRHTSQQPLCIQFCRDLLNDRQRMWASWLWPHYSPAVTVYPLIRIIWPMTFGKDFNPETSAGRESKAGRGCAPKLVLINRQETGS